MRHVLLQKRKIRLRVGLIGPGSYCCCCWWPWAGLCRRPHAAPGIPRSSTRCSSAWRAERPADSTGRHRRAAVRQPVGQTTDLPAAIDALNAAGGAAAIVPSQAAAGQQRHAGPGATDRACWNWKSGRAGFRQPDGPTDLDALTDQLAGFRRTVRGNACRHSRLRCRESGVAVVVPLAPTNPRDISMDDDARPCAATWRFPMQASRRSGHGRRLSGAAKCWLCRPVFAIRRKRRGLRGQFPSEPRRRGTRNCGHRAGRRTGRADARTGRCRTAANCPASLARSVTASA